ncbi:MAG: protein kinase domain-containing protein [Gemmatimonadaceae bacterium]
MAATLAPTQSLQSALAGRYTIERELGRGGMGVVYLARDLVLDRLVAIKLLPPMLSAQSELRERFLRETRTAAGLSHPNIVPIHAIEERDGLVYFVMGYIDGETLSERVQRTGPMPAGEAARMLQEAGWALSYAHGRGIVHRDVKADNILLERASGRAFITDFGIARLANSTMTQVGESLGTPQYMSPEQATGEPVDARSDLYSLGIVGFFALTGRLPFEAPTTQAILAMQVTKPATPVAQQRPDVPKRLADAIDKCLLKNADDRWPSAEAFVSAIQTVQGSTAVEIAPPVRNFQRMAEVALMQILVLTTVLPIVRTARPQEPWVIVMWFVAVVVITVLQIAGRARLLLRQGFGYDDVRAAFQAELRQRQEEQDAMRAGLAMVKPPSAWPLMVAIMAGGAMLGVGIGLARKAHLHTPTGRVALAFLAGGTVTIVLSVMFGSRRLLTIERRGSKVGARLWLGPFGRFFFRVVSRGVTASKPSTAAQSLDRGVLDLYGELPAPARKRLAELPTLIPALSAAATGSEERLRELDRALAEAGSARLDSERAQLDTLRAAGHSEQATRLERNLSFASDLQTARTRAADGRSAAAELMENLRLQLLRIRSGVGRPEDAEPDIAAARVLVAELGGAR